MYDYALRLKGFKAQILIAMSETNSVPRTFKHKEQAIDWARDNGLLYSCFAITMRSEEDYYSKTFTAEEVRAFYKAGAKKQEPPKFTISSFTKATNSIDYFGLSIEVPVIAQYLFVTPSRYITCLRGKT